MEVLELGSHVPLCDLSCEIVSRGNEIVCHTLLPPSHSIVRRLHTNAIIAQRLLGLLHTQLPYMSSNTTASFLS